MEILFLILIFILTVGIPAFLTVSNILNLFLKKRFIPDIVDMAIFILGPLFTLALYSLWSAPDWQEPVIIYPDSSYFPFHDPISNHTTILVLSAVAIIGYAILRVKKASLPPLFIMLCMSAMYIGCILSIAWILQLLPNLSETSESILFGGYLMCLFPFNFIVSTISLIRRVIKEIAESSTKKKYKSRLLTWSNRLLIKSSTYPFAAFILMWPLFGIITAVLVLFGQQPDAAIKAFTQTSDWLFSQKVSPEPIYMEDHYLCTVAAGGHRKLVKPQRFGIRCGRCIIVNRQLCIANAFEDLIAERTPRFHRTVRRFYDRYGYPISKHIKTPAAADITYILMKPLEWLFLIFLYLFDVKPEDRIARQYLPNVPEIKSP